MRLLNIPKPLLYGGILVVSAVGAYSVDRHPFDLAVVFVLGAVGFLMRRYDFPIAPVILGVVLGPLIDNNFRRGMILTDGDVLTLLTRPITLGILVLAAVSLALPYALRLSGRLRGERGLAELAETEGS